MLEDEIQQLRSELRETVDENGRLYKLLKERDFEIKHLKKKMEEDRLAFTGNSVVQAAGRSCLVGSREQCKGPVVTVLYGVAGRVSLFFELDLDVTSNCCML